MTALDTTGAAADTLAFALYVAEGTSAAGNPLAALRMAWAAAVGTGSYRQGSLAIALDAAERTADAADTTPAAIAERAADTADTEGGQSPPAPDADSADHADFCDGPEYAQSTYDLVQARNAEYWASRPPTCPCCGDTSTGGLCAECAAAPPRREDIYGPGGEQAYRLGYAATMRADAPPAPSPAAIYTAAQAEAHRLYMNWERTGTESDRLAYYSEQANADRCYRAAYDAPSAAHSPATAPTPADAYADACTRRDCAYAAAEAAYLAGDWNSEKLEAIYAAAHQEAEDAEVAARAAAAVAALTPAYEDACAAAVAALSEGWRTVWDVPVGAEAATAKEIGDWIRAQEARA